MRQPGSAIAARRRSSGDSPTAVRRRSFGDSPVRRCGVCNEQGGQCCTKCKSRHYCSKACQVIDWHEGGHKAECRQLAVEFQDMMLDELMPLKKVKEDPPIVFDVLLEDGRKAPRSPPLAPRSPPVSITPDEATPDWRGTCAICLDLLPVEAARRTFYECCCKRICRSCSDSCVQHDDRCPLCRTPPSKSAAELVLRLRRHVDAGNAEAQVTLGDKYRQGDMGVQQDWPQAFKLYELAALQGNARAQNAFAFCYDNGRGTPQIFRQAMKWYRKAADQGYPQAQYNLGTMSYHGKGCEQSFHEAVRWLRLAAAQGHAEAIYCLGACHQNGQGVLQSDAEAQRLYERAAGQGYANAAAAVKAVEAKQKRADAALLAVQRLRVRDARRRADLKAKIGVGAVILVVGALSWMICGY